MNYEWLCMAYNSDYIQMNEFISCITIRQSQIWCLLCTDISIHNKSYHLETPHFFDEIWCSPFFFPHLEWLIFAQDLYLHFKTTSFYGKHFDLIICLYFHKILFHHLLLIRLNNGKCKIKKILANVFIYSGVKRR